VADRYDERPLLRLIECYVLDAIGELDDADRRRLESVALNIGRALDSTADTWQGAIADTFELPPAYPDSLRDDWASNRAAAAAAGAELTSQAFAEAVADTFAG
jgi:hypothetical protein